MTTEMTQPIRLPSDVDDREPVFEDGPLRKNGAWRPHGGSELYLHSHISEPMNQLESDGLEEPISRDTLELSKWFRDSRPADTISEANKIEWVQEILRKFESEGFVQAHGVVVKSGTVQEDGTLLVSGAARGIKEQ